MEKDALERSSKSKHSKRKKAPAEDIGDDEELVESDGESGCTAQAEEDGNAEGLALPAMLSQEWLVANTASALADDFDTTVKIMFLDVGFTFCK